MSRRPPLSLGEDTEQAVARRDRVVQALSSPRTRRALARSLAAELLRREADGARVRALRDPNGARL